MMFHLYFNYDIPNITDWLTTIAAIVGVVIAGVALFQWKKQKEYEIVVDAKVDSEDCLAFVNALRFRNILVEMSGENNNRLTFVHESLKGKYKFEVENNKSPSIQHVNLFFQFLTLLEENKELLRSIKEHYKRSLVILKDKHAATIFYKTLMDDFYLIEQYNHKFFLSCRRVTDQEVNRVVSESEIKGSKRWLEYIRPQESLGISIDQDPAVMRLIKLKVDLNNTQI